MASGKGGGGGEGLRLVYSELGCGKDSGGLRMINRKPGGGRCGRGGKEFRLVSRERDGRATGVQMMYR